ncbi:hypothetical protein [Sharpea azabuensis]
MSNLLDLMSQSDREKMLARYHERTAKRDTDNKISTEVYLLAEFGYYFGWEAIQAVRHDDITIEEMFSLLEGARKVWYQKLVENARAMTISVASPLSKNGTKTFKEGMKPFVDRSKINV